MLTKSEMEAKWQSTTLFNLKDFNKRYKGAKKYNIKVSVYEKSLKDTFTKQSFGKDFSDACQKIRMDLYSEKPDLKKDNIEVRMGYVLDGMGRIV